MMNCICIDDEPLALKKIENYLKQIPSVNLIGACLDAFQALKIIEENQIDLIFCDINMPELNGLDFVKNLSQPPMIIFTTAYEQYAIEGYKVEAVDYLLKPFSLADVMKSVELAKKRKENFVWSKKQEDNNSIFIKCEQRTVLLEFSEILYIEAMSEYVKIFTKNNPKPLIPQISMKKLEASLPENFMRIHRSYIVNLNEIKEIQKMRIKIANELIPISDMYKDAFNDYVENKLVR